MAGSFQGQATSLANSSTLVKRDSSANTTINAIVQNTNTTTGASSTTTLTVASAPIQILVGKFPQTFVLPNATTLVVNQSYQFINNNTGSSLQVDASDSTPITTILPLCSATLYCIDNATVGGLWELDLHIASQVYPIGASDAGPYYLGMMDNEGNSGASNVFVSSLSDFYYTPDTSTLTVPNLNGTAAQATQVALTVVSDNQNYAIPLIDPTASVATPISTDLGVAVTYNPSTYTLTAPEVNANGANGFAGIGGSGVLVTDPTQGGVNATVLNTALANVYSNAGGGVSAIGTINTGTLSGNGASISGSNLFMQYGSASNPGLVKVDNATILANTGTISVGTVPFTSISGVATVAQTTLGVTALTPAATVNVNWALGNVFTITLAQNTTFFFGSSARAGQTIMIRITNTASNFTVTWPAMRWVNGVPAAMSPGAVSDVYTIVYDGTSYYASAIQSMS